jgi:hypothetical protein
VSSCRMMRRRDAPSDSRMPISRWRETPRASSRLATLAQPIIRISPKAKKIGEKIISASTSDARVPWLGVSLMETGPPGTVFPPPPKASARLAESPEREGDRSLRPDAHTVSPAVAACGDIPGFSRPTTSIAISSPRRA